MLLNKGASAVHINRNITSEKSPTNTGILFISRDCLCCFRVPNERLRLNSEENCSGHVEVTEGRFM